VETIVMKGINLNDGLTPRPLLPSLQVPPHPPSLIASIILLSTSHNFLPPFSLTPYQVNKITSSQTQIPYDYYSFPFCRPANGVHHYGENLGEFLTGDRIENSPYELQMKVDQSCTLLCSQTLTKKDVSKLKEAILEGYSHNWIIDNLPAASVMVDDVYQTTYYSRGFLVGLTDEKQEVFALHNHVRIYLDYHRVDGQDAFRVVGFRVRPFSIDHKIGEGATPSLTTCEALESGTAGPAEIKDGAVIHFSYDVQWEASDVRWASRWDIYLNMDHTKTDKVHWFSIANSALIVLFLTGMIAMILIRNLCRDITRYNRVPTEEDRAEEREESGWKLVHADVFRPPTSHPMLLSVMVGTGAQLLMMAFFTIVFAAVGFLSPANRGSLMIAVLLTYVLMGSVAGFVSARLYKTFKGKQWQKCTVFTALWYPSICFTVFLCLDFIDVSYGSSGAVPFLEMLKLLTLWFGISVPLVFMGAYLGYKRDAITFPVVTSNIPREIPDQPWYLSRSFVILAGGILPFGACFVELFFILTSMWLGAYYYVFGFLLLVFTILLVTCAEITIVMTYFQLCNEDYNWWWRSFLSSGSTALYVLLYSAVYFTNIVQPNLFATYLLYFGYMSIISLGMFLMTGCIGFAASLWFNRLIFSSIKVD